MDINSVSLILHKHQTDLDQFAVESLAVFGSVARGEATESIGLFEFIRLKYYLETLIGSKVDLVTPDALHPALRDSILNEAVNVG